MFKSVAWTAFFVAWSAAFNPVRPVPTAVQFLQSYDVSAKYTGCLSYNKVFAIVFKASDSKCFSILSEYWYTSQGENVWGSSFSLPYFVTLISFTQCAKKIYCYHISIYMSSSIASFFF